MQRKCIIQYEIRKVMIIAIGLFCSRTPVLFDIIMLRKMVERKRNLVTDY